MFQIPLPQVPVSPPTCNKILNLLKRRRPAAGKECLLYHIGRRLILGRPEFSGWSVVFYSNIRWTKEKFVSSPSLWLSGIEPAISMATLWNQSAALTITPQHPTLICDNIHEQVLIMINGTHMKRQCNFYPFRRATESVWYIQENH